MRFRTLLVSILFVQSIASASDITIMWAGGEHLELGEQGAFEACADLGISRSLCPSQSIQRADKKISFSYGEILTSTDYYDAPEYFYADKQTGIKTILACSHKQSEADQTPNAKHPKCNIRGILAKPDYLEVVSKNYAHFGWNNMTAYVKYHQLALDKAAESFRLRKTDTERSHELFNQALVINGFADHYLTDAFASGHIRVPRVQIKDWAKDHLSGAMKGSRGDFLTMLLHDHESQSLQNNEEMGLPVENSLGQTWVTRGDSHMHLDAIGGDPARMIPEKAVKESFKEILTAWLSGETPSGYFKAALLVPFHRDIPMIQKFTPEYQHMTRKEMIKAFYQTMPTYVRAMFNKNDLDQMLDALPSIFEAFRKDVNNEISGNSELTHRLPARYLEAYRNVN